MKPHIPGRLSRPTASDTQAQMKEDLMYYPAIVMKVFVQGSEGFNFGLKSLLEEWGFIGLKVNEQHKHMMAAVAPHDSPKLTLEYRNGPGFNRAKFKLFRQIGAERFLLDEGDVIMRIPTSRTEVKSPIELDLVGTMEHCIAGGVLEWEIICSRESLKDPVFRKNESLVLEPIERPQEPVAVMFPAAISLSSASNHQAPSEGCEPAGINGHSQTAEDVSGPVQAIIPAPDEEAEKTKPQEPKKESTSMPKHEPKHEKEKERRIADLIFTKVCEWTGSKPDDLTPVAKKAIALIAMDKFGLSPTPVARRVNPNCANSGFLYVIRNSASKLLDEDQSFKKNVVAIVAEIKTEIEAEKADTPASRQPAFEKKHSKTKPHPALEPSIDSTLTMQDISIYLLSQVGVKCESIASAFNIPNKEVWQAIGKVTLELGSAGDLCAAFQKALLTRV